MLDFSRFRVLTFDCYGTLVDWESGILSVLQPLLLRRGKAIDDSRLLELYGDLELQAESPYQPYRDVLRAVVRGLGQQLHFTPTTDDEEALPESLRKWMPWPDTVEALQRLKKQYQLAIISNVDDDLFAATARHLQVQFDHVITAEQAQCYKPCLEIFGLALSRIGVAPERVLHVGQSVYHDVIPAKSIGLSTVWVNRPSARPGVGAVKAAHGRPDLEISDLASLARAAVTARTA